MAYLHPSSEPPIPPDTVRAMGQAVGLSIPDEDLQELSEALRDQLASIDRIEALDLTGVAPPVQFDPRWHD